MHVSGKDGAEDVWVCYTMDHDVFEGWYEARKWIHHVGHNVYPSTAAALVDVT